MAHPINLRTDDRLKAGDKYYRVLKTVAISHNDDLDALVDDRVIVPETKAEHDAWANEQTKLGVLAFGGAL